MKAKYILMMVAGAVLASCMGNSYTEIDENGPIPYGNNNLTESKVITIAKLKDMFATEIETDYRLGVSYRQVTDSLQIKGIVTSSDAQGNIYNEIAIEDNTGAIIVSVAQNGLYGALPVGTEILLDLKDLYVGNYGLQAEIGVPTMNQKGLSSIGRIKRATWEQHYKILSTGNKVVPTVFATGTNPTTWDIEKDGGKLGIIRNVSFRSNDTKGVDSTYANANGGAGNVNWTLNEQDAKKVIVYNSNYADFANAKIPTGKVDITGIFKRFNDQWEIIIRTLDDVQPTSVNPFAGVAGTGEGTSASPFDVTRAISMITTGKFSADKEYYISGTISQIESVSTQYGNANYFISDDGTTANQLKVFRGKYLNGDKFTAANQISEGKKVVIQGKLTLYNGTPQVAKDSKIISIN